MNRNNSSNNNNINNNDKDSSDKEEDDLSSMLLKGDENKQEAEDYSKDFLNKLFKVKPVSKLLDMITSLVSNKKFSTFTELQQSYQGTMSRSICGKVWKSNSHIYKCLDCQIDENCAICVDCFEEDKHVGHRYRLIPSNSGCCDCGDLSAWKKEGCCSVHVKRENKDTSTKTIELPENTEPILLGLFMKRWLHDISNNSYSLITESITDAFNKFIEVLGDDFTLLLTKVIQEYQPPTGSSNSTDIYKGLCILASKNSPTLEKFIISLFISSEFRDNLAISMAESFDSPNYDSNLTVQLFTVESTALKIVSTNKFKHIVNNFIKSINATSPPSLSNATIWSDEDDEDDDEDLDEEEGEGEGEEEEIEGEDQEMGAIERAIQERIIELMSTSPSATTTSATTNNANSSTFPYQKLSSTQYGLVRKLYFKALISIAYIIKTKSSFLWLINHNDSNGELFKCLDSLAMAQGMNPNLRLTTIHTEYDKMDWINCFSFEIYISRHITRSIFDQFKNNQEMITHSQVIKFRDYLLNHVIQFYINESGNGGIKWKKGIRDISIPEYRVSKQPVSIHLPLHRALVDVLYFESIKFNLTPLQVLSSINNISGCNNPQYLCSILIEHVFRAFAMSFQFQAGMWVRNGDSMRNQMKNYFRGSRDQNSTLDLYLMQYLSLAMEPKVFYSQFLDRCELSTWFYLDGQLEQQQQQQQQQQQNSDGGVSIVDNATNNSRSPSSFSSLTSSISSTISSTFSNASGQNHKSESDRANAIIAENLLETLIWLVTDRTKIANLEGSNSLLRKELVHILSCKPQTFGDIYQQVSECFEESNELDNILKEISTFSNATGTESGIYHLKDWSEWNYFYPYHTKNQQQTSESNYQIHCKRTGQQNNQNARPLLPLDKPLPVFNGIESILHCEILHTIIFAVIHNSLTGSVKCSEGLLTCVIQLLYLTIDTYNDNNNNNQNNRLKTPVSPPPPPVSNSTTTTTTSSLSPPKNMVMNVASPPKPSTLSPRKIATSLVGLVSSKSTQSAHHDILDIGFTSDDILKNIIQPIKQNSSFISSLSTSPPTVTLLALLKQMLSNSKFESHYGSINQILNHQTLVNHLFKVSNNNNNNNNNNNSGMNIPSPSTPTKVGLLRESSSPNDLHSSQMKEIAMKRQMELMKLMKEQQKKFIKNNDMMGGDDNDEVDTDEDDWVENKLKTSTTTTTRSTNKSNDGNSDSVCVFDFEDDEHVEDVTTDFGSCAICRDEFAISKLQQRPFGYVGSLQKNSLLSYTPLLSNMNEEDGNGKHSKSEERRRVELSKVRQPEESLYLDVYDTNGSFITFCSHLIHIDCLNTLIDNNNNDAGIIRPPNKLKEFSCPMCRRASNIIIPYSRQKVTSIKSNSQIPSSKINDSFNSWLNTTTQTNEITEQTLSTTAPISYDQFINTIFESNTAIQANFDKIHNIWNLICSCISVYELSKRKNRIDLIALNLVKPAFQNLIRKTVEQSSLDIDKRIMDLKSLVTLIFNNHNNKEGSSPSFIKLDMFGLFVRYYFNNESLKQSKSIRSSPPLLYLITLFFIGTFIQAILYVYKFKNLNSVLEFLNNNTNLDSLDDQVKNICAPYLRKVCFLLCCIDPSLEIDYTKQFNSKENISMEFQILLKFLKDSSGLQLFFENLLFNNQVLNNLISNCWLSEAAILALETLPLRSPKEFSIINLPMDYHKFFLDCTSKKKCSKCNGENGLVKFVCLLCGDLLCLKDYFLHSNSNNSPTTSIHPIGVYLILSETYIIINVDRKSKLWGSVYLDAHHQTEDYGLKRGKPLTLNQERLDKLNSDIITLLNVHSLQTVFVNLSENR